MKNIKCGKSSDTDGISAEHVVLAHSRIHVSLLFLAFITHGYLPSMFMKTAIVPIILKKNIYGDTSDKNNYSPIALVIATSKFLKLWLSVILGYYIQLIIAYTVKSVSKYYTQHHSPVYTCFLDASKYFDKINYFEGYLTVKHLL